MPKGHNKSLVISPFSGFMPTVVVMYDTCYGQEEEEKRLIMKNNASSHPELRPEGGGREEGITSC